MKSLSFDSLQFWASWLFCTLVLTLLLPAKVFSKESPLNKELQTYLAAREREFTEIPAERKQQLAALAAILERNQTAGETSRLNFICTHNSRRSHLSQIWAWTAAAHYGIKKVETYSGGTEATAFNPRAVAALQRAGFEIGATTQTANPIYRVQCSAEVAPLLCFSKKYNDEANPREFIAVMTCTHADENCPVVAGATQRISLPYEDPKAFDGQQEEAAKYSERCAQIAREMLYLFSLVKS